MPAPFSDKRARRVARGPADPDGDHPGSFAHRTPQAHLARVQPSVPTSFGSGAPSPGSVLSWVPDSPESIPREERAALTTVRDRDRTQEEETRFSRASQGPRGSKPCADAQQGRACSGALLPPLPSDPLLHIHGSLSSRCSPGPSLPPPFCRGGGMGSEVGAYMRPSSKHPPRPGAACGWVEGGEDWDQLLSKPL